MRGKQQTGAPSLRAVPSDVMVAHVLQFLAVADLLKLSCVCAAAQRWVALHLRAHRAAVSLFDPFGSASLRILALPCDALVSLQLRSVFFLFCRIFRPQSVGANENTGGLAVLPPVPPRLRHLDLVDSFIDDCSLFALANRLPSALESLAVGSKESICHVSDGGLGSAVRIMPRSLTHLAVHGAPDVTDTSLLLCPFSLPRLVRLDATRGGVGRGGLPPPAPSRLEAVDFSHCPYAHDAVLMGVASPQLRTLCLASTALFTDRAMALLSERATALSTVLLAGCPWVSDDALSHLRLSSLVALDVSRCLQLTDGGLVPLVKGSPLLERINVDSCFRVTDGLLIALAAFSKELRSADLRGANVTDRGVAALAAGCTRLEHAGLASCTQLGDVSLDALAGHCADLVSLDVSCVNKISDDGVDALARCTALRALDVSWCFRVTSDSLAGLRRVRVRAQGLDVAKRDLSPKLEARSALESSPQQHGRRRHHHRAKPPLAPPLSPRAAAAVLGPRPRLSSNGSVSDWLPWLSLDVAPSVANLSKPMAAASTAASTTAAPRRVFGDRIEDEDRMRAFAGL